MGKFLERVLPTTRFHTLGYTWTLNPGPFNIKEHVLITVMANVALSGTYVSDVIATQRIFYNQAVSGAYQLLLTLSTQLIGFSLGGLLRRFLVYPSSMIWPGALVNSALFNTLHRTYGKPDRHISRHKFLAIAIACSFTWYFVPGFLWTGLSVFNWVCWIAPNNVVVNTLFGTSTGLGMGIFTFDWAMISFFGNPLIYPVRSFPWLSYYNRLIFFSSGGQRQIQVLASSFSFGLLHPSFTVSGLLAFPGSNSQARLSYQIQTVSSRATCQCQRRSLSIILVCLTIHCKLSPTALSILPSTRHTPQHSSLPR